MGKTLSRSPRSRLSTSEISVYGKLFVSYERNVTFHIIFVTRRDLARRAVARGVLGGGGGVIVELTYSENRVGHSENYGNNSITKF